MRHPIPKIVTDYYETVKKGAPPCCHTCESYTEAGLCREYHIAPPEEFAATPGGCKLWIGSIPF